LQQLNLVKNQIREIKENAFSGLNNFQKLHLDHNQIREIKEISSSLLKIMSFD
jgi:hypothetical protein